MRRLNEFDTVAISLPQGIRGVRSGSLNCHVLGFVAATAVLMPDTELDLAAIPPRVPDAMMSFWHAGSLVALKGELVRTAPSGDLRFTVSDGIQLDRRRASRAQLAIPLKLHPCDRDDRYDGKTVDVSADGLSVATEMPAAVGDNVRVSLLLANASESLEGRCQVTRVGEGWLALRFTEGGEQLSEHVGDLVIAHNRRLLRRRRPG